MHWVLWLKRLSLPPAGPVLIGLCGLAITFTGRAQWLGSGLILFSLVSLYLLSAPVLISRWLEAVDCYPRQPVPTDDPSAEEAPRAIVILDGGRTPAPPERGGETVTARTLERIDEGVRLYRKKQIPILVTGYGDLMARTLEDSFGITARWAENRSRNTYENAQYSAKILRHEDIDRIFVVTHFWHMRRALSAFRQIGFHAVPVPAGRAGRQPSERGLLALVPNIRTLSDSYLLLHELIGRSWYRLRYRLDEEFPTTRNSD